MYTLNLIQLGIGNVGSAVVDIIKKNASRIKHKQGVELMYCGFFTSKTGYYYPFGFPFGSSDNYQNPGFAATAHEAIERARTPFVVIDTTASDHTARLLQRALQRGGYVVLSNKKPLSHTQEQFTKLHSFGENKILYETTVGAALPVINTLNDLLMTGDEVYEIQGCLSGTLGFICSMMEDGASYSQAVKEAKQKGYTEPDPRDDLSGLDVARKALILARKIGRTLELSQIKNKPFYPAHLAHCSAEEFMNRLHEADVEFNAIFTAAAVHNNTLRYVARVGPVGVSVQLIEIPKGSQLGRLKGPDNCVIFKTKRYREYPLVIQGPGAGAEVTAAGVLADILKIGK